jgi:hypothetical protein
MAGFATALILIYYSYTSDTIISGYFVSKGIHLGAGVCIR